MGQGLSRRIDRRGFSLIELLVVIAILALLIALLVPAVQQARESMRKTDCQNKLHQIGVALHNYHELHRMFPPPTCYGSQSNYKANMGSWLVRLLPMMDQGPAYNQYDWSCTATGGFSDTLCADNYILAMQEMPSYRCPSDAIVRSQNRPDLARTSFIVCLGRSLDFNERRGAFALNRGTAISEISDGASNTMAASEVFSHTIFKETPAGDPPACPGLPTPFNDARGQAWARAAGVRDWGYNTWLKPNSDARECSSFKDGSSGQPQVLLAAARSFHHGGVQVLLCDGAVRFVSDSIDIETWRRLGDKADGETVGEF
ncbi:DUF1559 domain-containing protein [uncultured Gimesia sp.]|uniref:DUF1559 domain-containing protein n=1 Tax=uncultured Gimesia sp. TaxID=1678688 RepID=UPI0030DD9D17|tara:strand:+ start:28087 stop:29034 length:948 start_codon:yes stop_codon:yes gene_type:complete